MENIPDAILTLLRCPRAFTPLRWASEEEKRVSEKISGKAHSEALISSDGKYCYPVDDGIPLLIPESAIDLSRTKSALATTGEVANLDRSAR